MDEIGVVKNSQKFKSGLSLIGILLILLIAVLFFSKDLQIVGNFIHNLGWVGWFVSVLIFGMFGATPIPSEPFTILITTIYGPFLSAIITALGNLLSALMEYYVGKNVSNMTNFNNMRENLPWGLNKVPVNSPIFLIVARMLPGYGPKFISIISGIYKVPLLRYLWTAAISTSIGALIVAFGGNKILTLFFHK